MSNPNGHVRHVGEGAMLGMDRAMDAVVSAVLDYERFREKVRHLLYQHDTYCDTPLGPRGGADHAPDCPWNEVDAFLQGRG